MRKPLFPSLFLSLLLPISCQSVINPLNCTYGGTPCLTTAYCEPQTESCIANLSLTDITPKFGSPSTATPITITGTGFLDGMTVSIGGVAATSVTVKSDTQLTALAPAIPGRCGPSNVHLATRYGKTADKADGFRYLSSVAPSFSAPPANLASLPLGINQIIIADVNVDMQPDIILKNPSNVTVCPGSVTGITKCDASVDFPTLLRGLASFLRIHDYDHDGKLDLLLFPHSLSGNSGAFFHNTGLATAFTSSSLYTTVMNINDVLPVEPTITVANGVTELWTATNTGLQVIPYGSTQATASSPLIPDNLSSLQVARADSATAGAQLIGVRQAGGVIVLQRGTAAGTLASTQVTPLAIEVLRIADLDRDGAPDLIGTTGKGSAFYVARGQADSSYLAPVPLQPTPTVTSSSFEVAALTCDGVPGLVVLTHQNELSYLPGLGDGTFGTPSVLVSSQGLGNISVFAVSDLNGDGRTDLVYVTESGNLGVALNPGP